MLIDWFTVLAQIVNFLLLVWLMNRFLYRRILGAIDARENRIAARLAQAAVKETEAVEQLALYKAKLQQFEQQRESMLAQAKLEAEKLHTQMLERAREDIRTLQTNWTDDLERERNEFLLDLRRRAAAQIFEITRRTLADLTRVDIEECAVKVFLDKIQLIDDETCRSLAQGELVIRTPLDLPDEVRTQIRQVLEIRLQAPVMLRFQKAFGIGLGLELVGNGWRIGWNSDTYLDALEEDVRGALEHCKEPESVGVP
jgi:F-type H+-transporting ATPase subunit b